MNFSYHPASGQLTNISSSDGNSLTFTRDGALLTNVLWTGAVTGRVSVVYDREFRVATQLVNAATPIQFLYNGDSLLTNAGDLRLTYQPQNALLSTTALGAVADARVYSGFGELTNYTVTFSNTPFYAYALKFNALGRITNKSETIDGQTIVYVYAYDEANRLSEVRTNGVLDAAYNYDLNGNRLQRTNGVGTATYSYDDRDRLRERVVGAELTQFAYTPNGELRTQTVASASTTFTYDPRGNLRQVILPNTTQIEYVVDGLNRRVGKKVNGSLTRGFLYHGGLSPVAELDENNAVVSRFIHGTRVNVPEYMIRGGVTYRILCDHLGSVRVVINATNGVVAQRMDYDEFGVVLLDTNPGFQPFGFAGGLYDPDTGLVRFGARDYDAKTGQWTLRDPILFAGKQTSLYAYVFNDPLNYSDPLGTGPSWDEAKLSPRGLRNLRMAEQQRRQSGIERATQALRGVGQVGFGAWTLAKYYGVAAAMETASGGVLTVPAIGVASYGSVSGGSAIGGGVNNIIEAARGTGGSGNYGRAAGLPDALAQHVIDGGFRPGPPMAGERAYDPRPVPAQTMSAGSMGDKTEGPGGIQW